MAQTRSGNVNPSASNVSQTQRSSTSPISTNAMSREPSHGHGMDRHYGSHSPFALMQRLVGEMERVFGEHALGNAFGMGWTPQMDVFERGGNLIVHADMPGIKPEDVRVNVNDGMLTISGERRHEHEHESGGVHQCERGFGSFRRSISLPEGVDAESVTASFDNGVLEISMPSPPKAGQGRNVPIGTRAENNGVKH